MMQNKKLSLHDEVKKEAESIVKEIEENQEVQNLEFSDQAESALQAKIQAYEKMCAERNKGNPFGAEFSEELTPNFTGRTNDNGEGFLSEEDRKALRLGRELLQKQAEEQTKHEVNTEYHKHLNSENESSGKAKQGKRTGSFRMPKKKRLVLALAAVLVLVIGTSVTTVGSKSYLKEIWESVVGDGEKVAVTSVQDMDKRETEEIDERVVYNEVAKKINIQPVWFGYLPEEMLIQNFSVDEEQKRVEIFFEYKGEIIRYDVYVNGHDSSLGQKEEDKLLKEFELKVSQQKIMVEKYEVKNKPHSRYVISFSYNGVLYQLKGVMEWEEAEKIINKFTFL